MFFTDSIHQLITRKIKIAEKQTNRIVNLAP